MEEVKFVPMERDRPAASYRLAVKSQPEVEVPSHMTGERSDDRQVIALVSLGRRHGHRCARDKSDATIVAGDRARGGDAREILF